MCCRYHIAATAAAAVWPLMLCNLLKSSLILLMDDFWFVLHFSSTTNLLIIIIVQCLHSSSLTHTHTVYTKIDLIENFRYFQYSTNSKIVFYFFLSTYLFTFISVWLLFLHLAQFILLFWLYPLFVSCSNRAFKHKNTFEFCLFTSLSLYFSLLLISSHQSNIIIN